MQDYTDDEEEEQPDVDMENSYYEAKGLKEANPRAAITKFEHVSAFWLFAFEKNVCGFFRCLSSSRMAKKASGALRH